MSQQGAFGARAFYIPYVGYLHLIPRLIAWVAWPLPALVQPMIYQVCGIAVASASAAFFTLPECRFVIASDGMRAAMALLAITDCHGEQIFATINSCQVFLVPLALLLLRSERRGIARAIVVAMCTLTAPALILFFPLAVWKWLRGRSPVALVFAVGTLIQGVVVFTHPDPIHHPAYPYWVPFLASFESWIYRVLLEAVAGREKTIALALHGGVRLTVEVFLLFATAAIWVWWKLPPGSERRKLFSVSFALGYLLLVQMFVLRPGMLDPFLPTERYVLFGATRYFLMSGWLLLIAVAISIEWLARRWSSAMRCSIYLFLFAFGTYKNYRIDPIPDLHWTAQAPLIERWKVDRKGPVQIPINPTPWSVYLP